MTLPEKHECRPQVKGGAAEVQGGPGTGPNSGRRVSAVSPESPVDTGSVSVTRSPVQTRTQKRQEWGDALLLPAGRKGCCCFLERGCPAGRRAPRTMSSPGPRAAHGPRGPPPGRAASLQKAAAALPASREQEGISPLLPLLCPRLHGGPGHTHTASVDGAFRRHGADPPA